VTKIPRHSKLTYQILLCLYIVGIFSLSSIPPSSIPDIKTQIPIDKFVHFTEYAIFSFLLFKVIHKTTKVSIWWSIIPVVICAAILGAIDESYQHLTKRTPDIHDWIADVSGAVFCMILIIARHHKRKRRKRN
jgi:VanZ family protein